MTIDDVTFGYSDSSGAVKPVLAACNAEFQYRSIVGIAGNNAAGKTTLLNIIRGTLTPQSGTVTVDGRVVSTDGRRKHLPAISVVSQQPMSGLGPSMTVFENYVMACGSHYLDLRRAYRSDLKRECKAMLMRANIDLDSKLDEQARFLSGGQQQALSVLLSLNTDGRILLMDEPTASLSDHAAATMYRLLRAEVSVQGIAALLVSHRVEELIAHCDRILLLAGGRVAADLSPEHSAMWSVAAISELLNDETTRRPPESRPREAR